MEESEREVEVRSITGESIVISISPDKTIQQLKLLLKHSFNPVSISPSFHLFFKGAKLDLQSRISSHSIEPGEFIVVIPFIKKDTTNIQQSGQTESSSKYPNENSSSTFADSAWSDMMQDLSSMPELPSDENQTSSDLYKSKLRKRNEIIETCEEKCKGNIDDDQKEDLILRILLSHGKNISDEQNCERFIQVLDLKNCLYDLDSKECMLFREANKQKNDVSMSKKKSISCICPPWLSKLLKTFTFLNIVSGFFQLRREEITWALLKEYMDQIAKFGVQIDIKDTEYLSVICPKVVHITNTGMEGAKVGNAIVIVDLSTGQTDLVKNNSQNDCKQLSISNIVAAVKRRDSSFKTSLWGTVKLLMRRYGNMLFSLEDLLASLKNRGTFVSGNKAKKAKRTPSASTSSYSAQTQCHDTNPLSPMEMVDHLRNGLGSEGQIVHVEEIKARRPIYVETVPGLSQISKSALKRIGIDKMYVHQAESIQASLSGKNVVVATLTSSGKSLCYNLPVLEVLSQNLLACALYLFPTKALAQDQLRALIAMTEGFDASLNVGVYDGDTSLENRLLLRDNARLLISNPDMLHVSILPFHGEFSRILSNLRFVVIDETHYYKGAFGCHTALILRRLRRICSHVYGSDPSFIFCTATSANPREHAMELANLQSLELIQNDGSPSSQKHFVLWNPTLCLKTVSTNFQSGKNVDNRVIVKRSSPILDISRLFAEMVQHGLRSIAFCKSRKLCELILSYTREILKEVAPHLVDSICAYRGGYVAEDRRRIENDFFGGKLCGIAATNALELGIDVGHIDATLHLGFPGSISSLWQQAGRSGRREKPSLAVYVAFKGPLDQYFMKYPHKLFGSPIECCHINAQNQQVLEQHLVCAALELPLSLIYDEKFFGSRLNDAILSLRNKGYLTTDPSRDSSERIWTYIGHEKKPSRAVSIRSIEAEKYQVIDQRINEVIEEIEESKAFFQVYEGAVYMNQGKTYLVKKLDLSSKIAFCEEADLKYYTTIRDYTDIHVIGGDLAYPTIYNKNKTSKTSARTQTCKVTTTWFGFRRIQKGSNQVIDTVDLSLPPYSYESQAVWIQVPQFLKTALEIETFRAGLHAACHAILNVVPLYVICNMSDLAPECANPHDTRYFPERILLYDQHPGGSGVSTQVQPFFTDLLTAALELLTSCRCSVDTGCPNCVQNLGCHEYNEVLHKDAAIKIIKGVLDAENMDSD